MAEERVKSTSRRTLVDRAGSLSSLELKEQKSESSSGEHPTDPAIQDLLDQLDSLEKPMTMKRSTDAEKLPIPPPVTEPSQPLPQNVILKPIPPPTSAASRLPVSPRRRIIGIKTLRSTQQPNPAKDRIGVYNIGYNHVGRILISPKGG